MAKRPEYTTKDVLINQPLPTYPGDTYTVIPHSLIIDETVKNLTKEGFAIKNELKTLQLQRERENEKF